MHKRKGKRLHKCEQGNNDIIIKESEEKGLIIICKKTENMVISKRKKNKIRFMMADVNIEKRQKVRYLRSVLTESAHEFLLPDKLYTL